MHIVPDLTPEQIADLATWPADANVPHVRANMVMTLDGAIVGPNGTSRTISSPEDHALLLLLRRDADVLLVGASTVRQEGYRRPAVPLAIVSRSLDGLLDVPALVADAHTDRPRPIILTCEASDERRRNDVRSHAEVVIAGGDSVDLHQAIAALADRGLTRIHCEGGAHLLAQVIEADLLDELYCSITPRLLGASAEHHLVTAASLAGRRLHVRSVARSGETTFWRLSLGPAARVDAD